MIKIFITFGIVILILCACWGFYIHIKQYDDEETFLSQFIKRLENLRRFQNDEINQIYKRIVSILIDLDNLLKNHDDQLISVDIQNYILPCIEKMLVNCKMCEDLQSTKGCKNTQQAISNLKTAETLLQKKLDSLLNSIYLDLSSDGSVLEWHQGVMNSK